MATVKCPKHKRSGSQALCAHVKEAMDSNVPCPSIELRSYNIIEEDGTIIDEIPLGGWYCRQCIDNFQLPPDNVPVQYDKVDALVDTLNLANKYTCDRCFEEWKTKVNV